MDETDTQAIKNRERLNRHSEKLNDLYKTQTEYNKMLRSIDKKLSDEFFANMNEMYRYMMVGNGEVSLKVWRREMEAERKLRGAQMTEAKIERRKWIYGLVIFSLGVVVNYMFTRFGI